MKLIRKTPAMRFQFFVQVIHFICNAFSDLDALLVPLSVASNSNCGKEEQRHSTRPGHPKKRSKYTDATANLLALRNTSLLRHAVVVRNNVIY